MDLVSDFGYTVKLYANKLIGTPQAREDFTQDAFLKILELKETYSNQFNQRPESCKPLVNLCLKNLLIDTIRKDAVKTKHSINNIWSVLGRRVSNRRKKGTYRKSRNDGAEEYISSMTESIEEFFDDKSKDPFQLLFVKNAVEELYRLLPDTERKVFREIVDPSKEFTEFLFKRRAIQRIYMKRSGNTIRHYGEHRHDDPAIGQFLQIPPIKLKKILNSIESKFKRSYCVTYE